jgi:hypothetical protein
MANGMLSREYLADNDLKRYAALTLFGLLICAVCRRRTDMKMKLIIALAMFDAEKFSTPHCSS